MANMNSEELFESFVRSLSGENNMRVLFGIRDDIPEYGNPKYVDTFLDYCNYFSEQYASRPESFKPEDFVLFENGFIAGLIKSSMQKAKAKSDSRYVTYETKKLNYLFDKFPDEVLVELCQQNALLDTFEMLDVNAGTLVNCLQTISKKGAGSVLLNRLRFRADQRLAAGDLDRYNNINSIRNLLSSYKAEHNATLEHSEYDNPDYDGSGIHFS